MSSKVVVFHETSDDFRECLRVNVIDHRETHASGKLARYRVDGTIPGVFSIPRSSNSATCMPFSSIKPAKFGRKKLFIEKTPC